MGSDRVSRHLTYIPSVLPNPNDGSGSSLHSWPLGTKWARENNSLNETKLKPQQMV
jgi:hypothetical protein